MYPIRRTTRFKKDIKRVLKRGKDLEQLLTVVQNLAEGESQDAVYLDHPLKGQYHGKRDCHLEPDWILIYAFEDQDLVLYRTDFMLICSDNRRRIIYAVSILASRSGKSAS